MLSRNESDDFIIHAKSEPDLMGLLEKFFKVSAKYNLRPSAKKGSFSTKQVQWCLQIINKNGYKLVPLHMEATRNM